MMKHEWNQMSFIDTGGGAIDVYLDETLDCVICKVIKLSENKVYWQARRFGQPITKKYECFEELADYLRETL